MDEKKPNLKAVDLNTVEARPDEAIHVCTELLHRIVKKRDMDALEIWINRYIRRVAVAYPIQPVDPSRGMTPEKNAQLRVVGNLGFAVSGAAVWSEKVDVQKAEKLVHAELYLLDVLNVMRAKE